MELCVRSRRWQGCTGTVRASVGVLLLGLSLAQSVSANSACPTAEAPQSLNQSQYWDTVEEIGGFISPFVHSFLNTVQPKNFPQDLLMKILNSADQVVSSQELTKELTKEILVYQVGFLVCAAIGILYIVLMPLIGLFFACCRCCGNCGGKMYQKQTSSINCRRRTLYWSAFITTAIILAGNICMFESNRALHVSVDQGPEGVSKILDNINTFLTAVPQQIDQVINGSFKTVQEVRGNLNDIGHNLGSQIQQQFNKTLAPALQSFNLLNQETNTTSVQLNGLRSDLNQLQSSMNDIQRNVTAVKSDIETTLKDTNCMNCSVLLPDLEKLTLDTSIPTSSLDEFRGATDEIIGANLPAKIKKVEDYFNSIPQTVTNDTEEIVQKSKAVLDDIETQISQVRDDLPLTALNDVLNVLGDVQSEIKRYTPEAEKVEDIRWLVCLILSCVVLLVVVCNILGLLLGPMGLKTKADPTRRSCTADCGGIFLMIGAGFSFIFSWLLMIIVLVLFLLGGQVYTLLCRPWDNGQLLQFLDTPGAIPGLEIGPSLGLKTNISISEIYRDCEKNQPLWTTLHLYEIVNLDELLNVSKYTEQIEDYFDKTNITLSPITILSLEDKDQLKRFSDKANNVDLAAITAQMKNFSSINLNTLAGDLNSLAEIQNEPIKTQLKQQASSLMQIQSNIDTTIKPQLEKVTLSLNSLNISINSITRLVGEVLSNVEAAQGFLDTNTTLIIKTESELFLDCQLGYFFVYADWANVTITQQVGLCGPVAQAVASADIIFCSQLVEYMNTFWFSLGWCLIFFIPSIILSIKLAKYYRKMKYTDVFEDHIVMDHIATNQVAMNLFPRVQAKYS